MKCKFNYETVDPISLQIVPSCCTGVSKKGYAPYNHRKKNQDVYIAEKDEVTDSLYLCVMDGHGEVGDKVTAQLKKQIPGRLFAHPDWATDCNKALAEVGAPDSKTPPPPPPLPPSPLPQLPFHLRPPYTPSSTTCVMLPMLDEFDATKHDE